MVARLFGIDIVVAVERTDHHGATSRFGLIKQPIGSFLGVVEELHDKVFVRAARALRNPMLLGVDLVNLDAELVHIARIDCAEAAAAALPAFSLLNNGHLAAILGRRACACAARKTSANNQNIGIDRFGDIANGLRSLLPFILSSRIGSAYRFSSLLVSGRCAARKACTRSDARKSGAREEITT